MARPDLSGFDPDLTYYLCGPMTGYESYNYPTFEHAAGILRDSGLTIEAPHENKWPDGYQSMSEQELWQKMMDLSEKQVARSDGIILLPGWCHSSGALRELGWAKERRLPVYFYNPHTYELRVMHDIFAL